MLPASSALVLVCALALVGSLAAAAQNVQPYQLRRILILESFGRDIAPWNAITPAFKTDLVRRLQAPVGFYHTAVETARADEPKAELAFTEYLRALFNGKQPDLIVPVGAPATQFWWRHRQSLFPSTPVVVAGIESRLLKTLTLTSNDTAVTIHLDMSVGPETALDVLPDTTNIVVVLGDSTIERFWVAECQRAFAPYTNRLQLTWLNQLPLGEMCLRVASLPPRSVVGFGTIWVDAAGVAYEQMKALDQLCAVANAPVFGVLEEQLGHGIVGGRLFPSQAIGREAARIAAQVLGGESAGKISPPVITAGPPTFDWRELQRWGISERLLPRGSVVLFREPSLWQRYRWYFLGVVTIMLAQAATIIGLVVQRARRHRAEAAAYALSGRLISAQEEERRRIARDLHDDLNQRLALLSVELDLAGRQEPAQGLAPRLEHMSLQVKDLSSDVHRLSSQLHPAKLDQLGLAAAARTLCKDLSAQSGVPIEFTHESLPRELPAEIALCIYRVLQEALGNAIRHAKATQVRAELRVTDNRLRLSVTDNGAGFDPQDARNIDGLGLLNMRERARLVQGVLAIQAASGHGTRVELNAPLDIGPAAVKEGL